MVRTRIYPTEHQRDALAAIARDGGRRQSELIREAVDHFIKQTSRHHREAVLREAAGIWRNRSDPSDYEAVRSGWDGGWAMSRPILLDTDVLIDFLRGR